MKRLNRVFAAAALAMGLWAAGGAAQAGQLGAVKIQNPSGTTIYYQFRWGENGDWTSACVHPHSSMNHWIALDSNGRAPTPYIRFDCIGGDDQYTERNYRLNFYACSNGHHGKPYSFCWSGTRFVDLHEDR